MRLYIVHLEKHFLSFLKFNTAELGLDILGFLRNTLQIATQTDPWSNIV